MDLIQVPLWGWAVTVAGLILLVAADLAIGSRQTREPGLREASLRTVAVVALAVLFGIALTWIARPGAAGQFFAGWLTEYSLSVDNLFIFVVLSPPDRVSICGRAVRPGAGPVMYFEP